MSKNKKGSGTKLKAITSTENSSSITVSRDECILPIMLGKTFLVHNGLTMMPLTIKLDMLGNLIGEYIQTKKRCVYKRRKNKNKRKR